MIHSINKIDGPSTKDFHLGYQGKEVAPRV